MSRATVEYIRAGLRPPWPRPELPHIAVVGRSNVGKSSLINALFGRKNLAGVGKTPGKTRSLHFYLVNKSLVLADLPGYGYAKVGKKMRERWDTAIEAYLRSEQGPAAVIVLIDARHPPTPLDVAMADFLQQSGKVWLPVLTKADKVPRGRRRAHAAQAAEALGIDTEMLTWTSAARGEGMNELWSALREWPAVH